MDDERVILLYDLKGDQNLLLENLLVQELKLESLINGQLNLLFPREFQKKVKNNY